MHRCTCAIGLKPGERKVCLKHGAGVRTPPPPPPLPSHLSPPSKVAPRGASAPLAGRLHVQSPSRSKSAVTPLSVEFSSDDDDRGGKELQCQTPPFEKYQFSRLTINASDSKEEKGDKDLFGTEEVYSPLHPPAISPYHFGALDEGSQSDEEGVPKGQPSPYHFGADAGMSPSSRSGRYTSGCGRSSGSSSSGRVLRMSDSQKSENHDGISRTQSISLKSTSKYHAGAYVPLTLHRSSLSDHNEEHSRSDSPFAQTSSPIDHYASKYHAFHPTFERVIPSAMDSESFKALAAIAAFSSETIITATLEQAALERFAIDERFQAVMDLPETTSSMQLHKYMLLSQLSEDFMLQVRQHGRTIISEMYLPVEERTIKPIELKGVAGGTKFVHQGILFKCAVDKQKSNGSNDYIYGGQAGPSFEDAQEACGHELKGAINYYRFRRLGVVVPIQATVDFWGYKLSAMPFIRLAKQSLIYGSDDGGATIHADEAAFNLVMKKVATQLHLATHTVGGVRLDAAGDIEGHLGENGRVYLLDLARTFPPEHPLACKHLERPPQSVFFCFLRPEFLQLLKERGYAALSPDSLTGWGASDPEHRTHAKNLFNATKFLFDDVIPHFAAARDGLHPHDKNVIGLRCQAAFHSAGINVRHAGLVRTYFNCPRARKALLLEMVSRVLKNILRRWFRLTARCHPNSEYKMREVLLLFLNLVSNPGPKSDEFWGEHVTVELLQKFGEIALEPEEREDLYSAVQAEVIQEDDDIPQRQSSLISTFSFFGAGAEVRAQQASGSSISEIIVYVAEMTGVHFSPNCLNELSRSSTFEFCGADVSGMEPRTKHMSIVNFADAQLLAHQAKLGEHSIDVCLRLLHLACGHFQHALQSDPLNDEMKSACATSDKKFKSLQLEVKREFEQADNILIQAVKESLKEPDVWSLKIAQENLTALIGLWSHRLGYLEVYDRFRLWGSTSQRMLLDLTELLWLWERKVLEFRVHLLRTRSSHRDPNHEKLPPQLRRALSQLGSPRSRTSSSAGALPTPTVTDEISAMKAAYLAWVRLVAEAHSEENQQNNNNSNSNDENRRIMRRNDNISRIDAQLQAELHSELLEAIDVKGLRAVEWFVGIANYHARFFSANVRLTPIVMSVDVSTGRTPLFFAVEREAADCITFLVRSGSRLEQRDVFGNTPFLFACHRRLFRMMSLLAHLGANIYAETSPPPTIPAKPNSSPTMTTGTIAPTSSSSSSTTTTTPNASPLFVTTSISNNTISASVGKNSKKHYTILDYAEAMEDDALIQHFRTLQVDADKERHMLAKKAEIVQEILKRLEIDADYLAVLTDFYLPSIQKEGLIKQSHIDKIFGNIMEVRKSSLLLLAALYKCANVWDNSRSCLGPAVEEIIDGYSRIAIYCRSLNSGLRVLDSITSVALQKNFSKFAEAGQQHIARLPADCDLSLPFLLEVPRAQLLFLAKALARALDSTPESHKDYSPLQTVAVRFDDLRSQADYEAKCIDNEEKVLLIEQQFNANPGFAEPGRFLLREGMLIKKSRNADHKYTFYLFSDMLAYASKVGLTKKLKLHRVIPLDRSFLLRESPAASDDARTFAVVSAHKSFVIVAESLVDKQEWVVAISHALGAALRAQATAENVPTASLRPLMEQVGEQAECPLCKKAFSWFNRRYHCHSCGAVVCKACSRGRRAVTGERICSLCSVYEVHRPRSYSFEM